jgi:hypothetical protein
VGSAAAVKTRASIFNIVGVLSVVGGQSSGCATVRSFESHGLRGASRQNRGRVGAARLMADRGPDDGFQTANLHFKQNTSYTV